MANLWNTLVPAVTCNSTMMLKQMVVAGQGLAFLSKVAFLEEIANGTVVWRPFAAGMSGTQHMAVVISSLRVLSPVTRDFVQRLIQRMKQMEAGSRWKQLRSCDEFLRFEKCHFCSGTLPVAGLAATHRVMRDRC
jgi:hypothetical protein